MSVAAEFEAANKQYESSFDKGDLAIPPARKVFVLACMDARLDPAKFLGLQEGDAHVAVGRAVEALRSAIISQQLLGTREIVVHPPCEAEPALCQLGSERSFESHGVFTVRGFIGEWLHILCLTRQTETSSSTAVFHGYDVRSRLSAADLCTIKFELSSDLNDLLHVHIDLAHAMVQLLADSELISHSTWAASTAVFRVGEGIVVKIASEKFTATELRSLLYLQEHLPAFPAPRPHGLVRIGIFCLLFTTFMPRLDLERAWPQLDEDQERNLSDQLDELLTELRSLPCPSNTPLGGIGGEGCKDARRGLRINKEPIVNSKQFQDFIFSGSKTASPLYRDFLSGFVPTCSETSVFTHGDIRPENIMVDQEEDGSWRIVAIIDWEASGFYPEYWGCVKMTNNLTTRDNFDWYRYLPKSSSPRQHPIKWLVDRL